MPFFGLVNQVVELLKINWVHLVSGEKYLFRELLKYDPLGSGTIETR